MYCWGAGPSLACLPYELVWVLSAFLLPLGVTFLPGSRTFAWRMQDAEFVHQPCMHASAA